MTDTLASAGHPVPMMPMGVSCAVHKHRTYVPMERHHRWPIGMGGPDVAANIVTLCCNGHYEVHEYLRQLILHGGVVPPELSRHFGVKVRALARAGWEAAGSPTHGGGSE